MKKLILILTLTVIGCLSSNFVIAQSPRLQLFEYFDNTSIPTFGAVADAHFDSIAAANADKMTFIKYHVAWGSETGTDPMNLTNPDQVATRVSYYNVTSDPLGFQDGGDTLNPTFNGAQPDTFSQSYINNRDTVTSPYTITVSHYLNATGDSMETHTVITKTGNTTGVVTAYVVVIEKLITFDTAPGYSGDTRFLNVMKEMLPSASGVTLQPMVIGDSVVYDLSWLLANVYDTAELAVVSFVQNRGTREVYQAAYSPPTPESNDAGISAVNVAAAFSCDSILPVAVLQNLGTVMLTTCTINYQTDSSTPAAFAWSGNLAPDSSVNVTLPGISATGYHLLQVYLSQPNGVTNTLTANDSSSTHFAIAYPAQATPVIEGFEGAAFPPTGWDLGSSSNDTWQLAQVGAFGTSSQSALLNFGNIWTGNTDDLYPPAVDLSSIASANCTFDVAYAPFENTNVDTLKVNVSTDCSATWTTLYSKWDSSLATAPNSSILFVPTDSQWRLETIDLSAYNGQPDVQLQFHGISGYGNTLYIDNVNISSVTGIASVKTDNNNLAIYPNPAQNIATIELQSNQSTDTHILIYDLMGNEVMDIKTLFVSAQDDKAQIDISGLSDGLYIVKLLSGDGEVVSGKLGVIR